LIAVSALWGASFLLMRITVPVLGPVILAESRVLIAGLVLLAVAAATRVKLEFWSRWKSYLVLGLLNGALPFTLISAAELHLSASVAVILNATTPLFGALFSSAWRVELMTGRKWLGLLVGFIGIGVLVGWNPEQLDTASIWSVVASLIAAAGYGAVNVYTKVNLQGVSPIALATSSQLTAAAMLLPLIPFVPLRASPSVLVLICTLILAVFCTAVARVLHFRLIINVGPVGAALTTYLAPGFGIIWGWMFLGEVPNAQMLLGLALILSSLMLVLRTQARNILAA